MKYIRGFLSAFLPVFCLLISLYVYDALRVRALHGEVVQTEMREVSEVLKIEPILYEGSIDAETLEKIRTHLWQARKELYRITYLINELEP